MSTCGRPLPGNEAQPQPDQREGGSSKRWLCHLTALEHPSRAEAEAIELLTLLVERYEQAHYPIPAADPISVVRFLMAQQHLKQRDLIPAFGSENAVSMFLAGQRKLTVAQIRELSARFKLPADVFLGPAG